MAPYGDQNPNWQKHKLASNEGKISQIATKNALLSFTHIQYYNLQLHVIKIRERQARVRDDREQREKLFVYLYIYIYLSDNYIYITYIQREIAKLREERERRARKDRQWREYMCIYYIIVYV